MLAQRINGLSLNQNDPVPQGTWDPSTAPGPQIPASNFTTFPRPSFRTRGPSGYTIQHGRSDPKKWFQNDVCVRSPYQRKDFKQGQVISVPYHVANFNQNADVSDNRIVETWLGPVLSKRRMFIILHIHLEGFFCLPLYSFESRGIKAKCGPRQVEYISVMDMAHKATFENVSAHYKPLVHVHDNPNNNLSPDTVCHLTGGVRVSWQEQILPVGRLTQDSFMELLKHYKNLCETAEQMPWD